MNTIKRRSGLSVKLPDAFKLLEAELQRDESLISDILPELPELPEAPELSDLPELPEAPTLVLDTLEEFKGRDKLIQSLVKKGFQQIDQLELEPVSLLPPEGLKLVGRPAKRQTFKLSLPVLPSEHAVVLLEQDGVYTWNFPRPTPPVVPKSAESEGESSLQGEEAPEEKVLDFEFSLESEPEPTAGEQPKVRGLVGDFLADKTKAYVLKFAGDWAVGQTAEFLERDIQQGLILMPSTTLEDWKLGVDLSSVASRSDRPARILLFIHGTFSSTKGAFGALTASDFGRQFLETALANYDAVIGFDHKTLSVDPKVNATDLLTALSQYPWSQPPQFDVVTHSRGGLVFRSLAELVLPGSGWKASFDHVVFVAAANGGTLMAEPDNWHYLVDLYTNLAVAAEKVIGLISGNPATGNLLGEMLSGIGNFIQWFSTAAITDKAVPGLAAMEPDGDFIRTINRTQPGQPTVENSPYFAVIADFEPKLFGSHEPKELSTRLLQWVANGVVDELMRGTANDLVVDTPSMTCIDPQAGNCIKDKLDFGKTPEVYHSVYFTRKEVTDALTRWFGL